MPSRVELVEYYGDNKLTNAIKRYPGGYYAIASELGLEMKESDTNYGKLQERIAIETLTSMGYDVKHMVQNHPYDLLVNNCLKIDVKMSRLYNGNAGSFYSCNLEKPFCTCDIYIIYLLNDDFSTKDILIIPSKFIYSNTQIGIGEKTSKYYVYSNRWDFIQSYVEFFESIIV